MHIHPSEADSGRRDAEADRIRDMLLVDPPPLPSLTLRPRRVPAPVAFSPIAAGALMALGVSSYEWLLTPSGHQLWYQADAWGAALGGVWLHDPARLALAIVAGAAGLLVTGLTSRDASHPKGPAGGRWARG
jgi:hypothetical protein